MQQEEGKGEGAGVGGKREGAAESGCIVQEKNSSKYKLTGLIHSSGGSDGWRLCQTCGSMLILS